MTAFSVGDVLCASPYIVLLEPDNKKERKFAGPVWMIVNHVNDKDFSVDILFTSDWRARKMFEHCGYDTWTSGLEGTVHTCPRPEEWPDEVCVAVVKRKLGVSE